MFHDKVRNWDKRQLAGDHSVARAAGGKRADRLLHATCNEQAGDHTRDHLRPALTGAHPSEWALSTTAQSNAIDIEPRLMPWP